MRFASWSMQRAVLSLLLWLCFLSCAVDLIGRLIEVECGEHIHQSILILICVVLSNNSMGDYMNYNKVKTVIDNWDPIELLTHAPKDEYALKCKKIYNLITSNTSVEFIARTIFTVFAQSFGKELFNKTLKECTVIAKKILS